MLVIISIWNNNANRMSIQQMLLGLGSMTIAPVGTVTTSGNYKRWRCFNETLFSRTGGNIELLISAKAAAVK